MPAIVSITIADALRTPRSDLRGTSPTAITLRHPELVSGSMRRTPGQWMLKQVQHDGSRLSFAGCPSQAAIAPLPPRKNRAGLRQRLAVEIRPQHVGEVQLGIGRLP